MYLCTKYYKYQFKLKNIYDMLTKIERTTFKCKQCGHVFASIYTEGGFIDKLNLPHCPKCVGDNTRKATLMDQIFK